MTTPERAHDPLELGPRSWRNWLAPGVMALVTLLGVGAVFWGRFVDPPAIAVLDFDAGPVAEYSIGDVRPFPDIRSLHGGPG